MTITLCTKDDFDEIYRHIEDFWGSDRILYLHHPMLIREFGNTAFVAKEDKLVLAYLFGFLSQTEPTAYVHLVAVRQAYQHRGLGQLLYGHFSRYAIEKGCLKLKAITLPENSRSISFHQKMGMQLLGEENENGVKVVRHYSGPGKDRVVFEKEL